MLCLIQLMAGRKMPGLHFRKLRLLQKLMENPEMLERPLNEEVEY